MEVFRIFWRDCIHVLNFPFSEYSVPSPNTYVLPDTFRDAPRHSMTYRAFETEGENIDCCKVMAICIIDERSD